MPLGNSGNFSSISDDQLDEEVQSILQVSPNSGERMLVGGIRAKGLIVQRRRVRASIVRIDPVSRELRQNTIAYRRVYNVPTPNSLWHLDGNHKLITWQIIIHGGIDGFSRAVVFLKASTNNKSCTVLNLFQAATHVFHYLRRIRTDHGTENIAVAREMLYRY
ncbi:hypothetical protein AC249_AIPGENE26499 [Paramuricea clavata]|uniref:Uncharacterized protein n=1 Tax=Paramuricea clavata TaxID=317549 RepID=A0A7D9E1H2_PARCT|nr:hypothetical protein AC249_AIPGENE26499 [Paramuricea clavata]